MDILTTIAAWVGAIASLLAGIAAIIAIIKVDSQEKRLEARSMHDEYVDVLDCRSIFWDALRQAYKHFQLSQSGLLPEDLMKFLDSCGMPPGLSGVSNIRLYEPHGANPDQRVLYRFVSETYPTTAETKEEWIKRTIIDDKIAADFFRCRSKLGGFWERWTNRVEIKKICKHEAYSKDRELLIMLTWLDIAHRKWVREDHSGKRQMYRLAEELIKRRS